MGGIGTILLAGQQAWLIFWTPGTRVTMHKSKREMVTIAAETVAMGQKKTPSCM